MKSLKEHLPQSVTAFTEEILDLETAIVLVIDKKVGVVGANIAFFDTLPFKSLDQFRKAHKDISELFLESKETLSSEKPYLWVFEVLKSPRKNHHVKI